MAHRLHNKAVGTSKSSSTRPARRATALVALALGICVLAPALASAATLTDADELGRFGSEGSGAGQFKFLGASAADPATGHLYVLDTGLAGNHRIAEFTPWGEFVKAFGWDVAPAAVNEQQEVRVRAGAGTFKLGFEGSETADLPFDAGAAEVQNALDALSSIGGAGGSVALTALPGKAANATPSVFIVTFKGSLAATNVAGLTAASGATPLSGGNPKTELEVRTRVDGTPGGTGLESCSEESGCQAGSKGPGAGQFNNSASVAVDAAGDLYVAEFMGNAFDPYRVQKLSPSGHFLWTIGGEVDKTSGANLCTAASGHECGAPLAGSAPGEFESAAYGIHLAIAPDGSLLAASGKRVQRFDAAGEYQSEVEVPAAKDGIKGLAADPLSGALYVTIAGGTSVKSENVHKLDPATGQEIGSLKVENPTHAGLATDPAGDVFVAAGQDSTSGSFERVIEFDSKGNRISVLGEVEPILPKPLSGAERYSLEGLGINARGDLYASYVVSGGEGTFIRFFGPPPISYQPPPPLPPQIAAQFATSVGSSEAELKAEINPRFWDDTSFRLEYGASPCSEGGCTATAEVKLTDKLFGAPLSSPGVILEGLKPGTTYHYRFIAQSTGGGPVFGPDATFTTFREAGGGEPCPQNEAFRVGPSALLPDCRAYEMVSPLDKEGGDVAVLGSDPTHLPGALSQAALDGGKLAYGSYRAFGDAQAGPFNTQYVAGRRAGVGWQSHAVSPPRGKAILGAIEQTQAEFQAFSPDLCTGWLQSVAEPPLAPGAPGGNIDLYRRSDEECGGPSYVPLNTEAASNGLNFELQGVSADGETTVFLANRKLATGGKEGEIQLYGEQGGKEKFLCILPGGAAFAKSCMVGTGQANSFDSQENQVTNALSADGKRVYWTASGQGSGKIYLRENPFGSGSECLKETAPCTLEVSKAAETEAGSTGADFWAAAKDGSKAIFTSGGRLYEYRLADKSTHPIAKEALGVMGASEDASLVYFASREDLDGGGPAKAGEVNLYLHDAGGAPAFRFLGALASADLSPPSPIHSNLRFHVSRVSPDGESAAFSSYAPLSGYDNTDRNSGNADAEVFLYDARANEGAGRLLCASCNPSGARPAGQEFRLVRSDRGPWTAARIPVPQSVLYGTRVLAEDGRRLFFDSFDALSPRDTNGREDVYQWEAAGEGSCKESSPAYSPANGGCVELISSGASSLGSEFLDADPSGEDVFFTTLSGLVPQDYGLQDVYDARVDGGLPVPPPLPAHCEGEACQSPSAAPNDPTPASASFRGAGDAHAKAPARRKPCAKGKARRHGRCVAGHHRRAKRERRAAR